MDEDHESLAWPLGPYAVKPWSLSRYTLAFVDTVAISAALKAQRTYACSPGVAAETRRSSQITVMILVEHPLDASIISTLKYTCFATNCVPDDKIYRVRGR